MNHDEDKSPRDFEEEEQVRATIDYSRKEHFAHPLFPEMSDYDKGMVIGIAKAICAMKGEWPLLGIGGGHFTGVVKDFYMALADVRVAVLEECCKVVCEPCRNNWPISEVHLGEFWWHENYALSTSCKGGPLRKRCAELYAGSEPKPQPTAERESGAK